MYEYEPIENVRTVSSELKCTNVSELQYRLGKNIFCPYGIVLDRGVFRDRVFQACVSSFLRASQTRDCSLGMIDRFEGLRFKISRCTAVENACSEDQSSCGNGDEDDGAE